MVEDWQHGGFGLYVHWPFCAALCPYCDFNSYVSSNIETTRWAAAYVSEINRIASLTQGRVVTSVYFGGGTPSLMPPELVAEILECVRANWILSNNVEITLEANPTSTDAGRFRGYHDAGVDRLSLGVQALNDNDLKLLGRLHSASEAVSAYELSRSIFDRVSFDLIYARQDQSLADWAAELRLALSMLPDHLSLYQLSIEAGTAFGDRFSKGKLLGLPDEDQSADMYQITQEICDAAGLPAYEVSNHAKPGFESSHNLIYWRGGDYAGIGPGAHGRLSISDKRFANDTYLAPSKWLSHVKTTGSGDRNVSALSAADHANEYLMMGLRTNEGISTSRFANILGNPLNTININSLVEIGVVFLDGEMLKTTAKGRLVLNSVLKELLI